MPSEIQSLLTSPDPALRYRAQLLSQDPTSPDLLALQAEIKTSPTVTTLLSERTTDGTIPHSAYTKWRGAHWVLADLADLHYPPGDPSLLPLRDQQMDWLLSTEHQKYFETRTVAGRVRMHPSQEGNAIYSQIKLGIVDDRIEQLIQRLYDWQWPDGGWNCDMNPATTISSFMESLLPLRALAHYHQLTDDPKAAQVAEQAAEIFLKRHLYKRLSNNNVMKSEFKALHYPCYWHYDILFGLKVMAEAGFIQDPRCADALDLLESKRLPDGGFPAEKKYYRAAGKDTSGSSRVNWGGASKKRANPWVTADALYVLKQAGR
jgi:hypothetical protein